MKDFKIKARTIDGSIIEEVVSAETEFDAGVIAAEKDLFVLDISIVTQKSLRRRNKASAKELIVFCHQMSAMLHAGVTTDKALNLVRIKTKTPKMKAVYSRVYEEVQKGEAVSAALGASGAFPDLFVNMIKSGETTGDVGTTFVTLADFYEKEAEMNRKVKSAMIYPAILGVLTIVITLALVIFVLPGITESFSSEDLPWLTATLMNLSSFLTSNWYIILGIIGVIVYLITYLLRIDTFKIAFDKFKIEIPVIGDILKTIYSARAANTIASLYAVGSSMLSIVEETGGTIGNRYIETLFDDIYIKVSTGEFLSKAMEDTGVFDPMLYSMIEIGEEAGDLEVVLTSISKFFDREATSATEQLVSLLEPLMLIVMGIIVGVIVVAIMLPIINMGNVI